MSGRIWVCTAAGRACVGAVSVEPPDKESGSGWLAVGGGGLADGIDKTLWAAWSV